MPSLFRAAIDDYQRGSILDSSDGLGAVPSGYGAEYDQLFAKNPYRNLTYKKSGWQNLLSALGFRTDADRWLEDAQVNASEYDAGIFQMMQQNEFNSPEAQAERMRQAGMNPDLLGIGDVAGASSPVEDPNGMSQNVGDEFQDFGNTVMSVFSRAMTVFKDFKTLEQMNAVIDGQNIDNARSMVSAIDDFIVGNFTASDFKSYDAFKERAGSLSSALTQGNGEAFSSGLSYGLSKRQIPQYNRMMRERLLSIASDEKLYNKFKDSVLARAGAKEVQTNPFSFNPTGSADDDSENAVDIMVKGLVRANKLALKYTADANAARASVQNQEAQTLEQMSAGVASAGAQVSDYNSKKAVAKWNADCARIKKDMLRQLERCALNGDWLAKAMLFSWSLDDIAKASVSLNAGANLGLNFGLGANISNSVSTIFAQ